MKSFITLLVVVATCLLSAILSTAIPTGPSQTGLGLRQPLDIDYDHSANIFAKDYIDELKKASSARDTAAVLTVIDERINLLYGFVKTLPFPPDERKYIWTTNVIELAKLNQIRLKNLKPNPPDLSREVAQWLDDLDIPDSSNMRKFLES
ncbi:hypothetical protein H0H93_008652, partial [Arthromyces matolae]